MQTGAMGIVWNAVHEYPDRSFQIESMKSLRLVDFSRNTRSQFVIWTCRFDSPNNCCEFIRDSVASSSHDQPIILCDESS